ncbi:LPO_1073/Vpar_1526 family protein [Streptomyces sp. NPDC002766]|uniref:LPO_1073/Vpar_1526 family protein n=1 Tax=Streptomyces sp. NPDC002766 TaxID=3154429 RepID=UPI00333420C3
MQANTVNNNYGISVQDAEHICLKLIEEKFASHSVEAYRVAKERFEEFAFNYLKTLTERSPQAIENLSDPGIQSAILEAEEGFAKTGDENLGQILVEMLVKRTSETRRDVRQLALNEAIATAQKLATKHIDALSLLFFLRRVQVNSPTLSDFLQHTKALLEPACESFAQFSESDAQYLEATGCVVRTIGSISWPDAMKDKYPGYFHKGVSKDETPAVDQILQDATKGYDVFRPSWHDPDMIRVDAVTQDQARELAGSAGLDREALASLMTSYPLPAAQITEMFTAAIPALGPVLERWPTVGFESLEISLTGIAIGHANFKKSVGNVFNAEIDIWIN